MSSYDYCVSLLVHEMRNAWKKKTSLSERRFPMLQIRHAQCCEIRNKKKRNDPETSQNGHLLEYVMTSP